MPQPRPFKDVYDIIKDTKKDLKNNIKPPFDHAIKGNKRFIEEITKINWETLPSKDVLVMILTVLSYGLKVEKKAFEDYIRKENMKSTVSLFKFMLDGDGLRMKNCLNTGGFTSVFEKLFTETDHLDDCEKTLKKLHKRVVKIKAKDLSDEELLTIKALVDSIIKGKEIEPELLSEIN